MIFLLVFQYEHEADMSVKVIEVMAIQGSDLMKAQMG